MKKISDNPDDLTRLLLEAQDYINKAQANINAIFLQAGMVHKAKVKQKKMSVAEKAKQYTAAKFL